MMGAERPSKSMPADQPLWLRDAAIGWEYSSERPLGYLDIEPIVRLGGAIALSYRIRGLCNLLEPHETLAEDETRFLKAWLDALSLALFMSDDEGPAAIKVWRRPGEQIIAGPTELPKVPRRSSPKAGA